MPKPTFHPTAPTNVFVQVVLPLALPGTFTYSVPEPLINKVAFGLRVEVEFGRKKRYTALVVETTHQPPDYKIKPILDVIDSAPIIHPHQYTFWEWLADYYCCTIGEVMEAALPAYLKLTSERRIILSPVFDHNFQDLNDREFMIAEALTIQEELSISDVQDILQSEAVMPVLNSMLNKQLIYLKEELKERYKPKEIPCLRLKEPYLSQRNLLNDAFKLVSRSERQENALLALVQLQKAGVHVRRKDIYEKVPGVDSSVLNALAKKQIIELYSHEVSRLGAYEEELAAAPELAPQQSRALGEIKTHFEGDFPVLLHGVTGSGKTRIYVELIRETLAKGQQVLYLLPEVALTTQIIKRLQRVLGDEVFVYHHRINNNERVEAWRQVANGQSVVLGARSAIFLPFVNLGLIIVDEEHDPSFKQSEPAPRYHGRDAAVYMSVAHKANIVLGTATPSVETFYNTLNGKYRRVTMSERFGGISLPQINLVPWKFTNSEGRPSLFSDQLINAIKKCLDNNEQVILFQNRRGYSPTFICTTCKWNAECKNCDVSLTYHKFFNNLQCHYCGFNQKLPETCPACGSSTLLLFGAGTEQIEETLSLRLPEVPIARMDFDTVRTKDAHGKLISDFEDGNFKILIGTQMVTKGLDFDRVGLVGVINADALLRFPDFRASERAFQLITQVAGRAGRKNKKGTVMVQTMDTTHPVLQEVLVGDYKAFFDREVLERQAFQYPPFGRLIKITVKHRKANSANDAAKLLTHRLREKLGNRVQGPAIPPVGRIRNWYLLDLLIKLPNQAKAIVQTKAFLRQQVDQIFKEPGLSNARIIIDVDPS